MKRPTQELPNASVQAGNYLVATVLMLVPFHAFLTVWFSSIVGHYTLLRLWDDIILAILCILVCLWMVRDKTIRQSLRHNVLIQLIAAYAALTFVLGIVALARGAVRPEAVAYGVLINLRYFAWFLAVVSLAQRSAILPAKWLKLVLVPAVIVVVFAVLQYSVLPHNFLSHFGYNSATTIPPIETINHNDQYIRAQSTLRGANPLGAYLIIVLSALSVLFVRKRRRILAAVFGLASLFALYASGSRSAWVGSAIAIGAAAWLSLRTRRARIIWAAASLGLAVVFVVLAIGLRNQVGFENALLHTQKHSAVATTSNAAHASALRQGLSEVWHQPFGDGPGSAGQASAYNAPHPTRIAEDYYVQIAQETGWLGLALFVGILCLVGRRLYVRSFASPLALTALVSLLGISFVCLLSHAWSDDTLAFVWWGLAGLALALPMRKETHEIQT